MRNNKSLFITSAFNIILGIIFLVWKNQVVSIAMSILGALLVVQSILHLVRKDYTSAIIKASIGIIVIVFGWALASAALFIMSAVWLIYGVMQLLEILKFLPDVKKTGAKVIMLIRPVMDVLIAGSLLFNQSGTVAWVFIIAGIFLIIEGCLSLIDALATK